MKIATGLYRTIAGPVHASDIDKDCDNDDWWSSCACGWIHGPHDTEREAAAQWLEHVAEVLRA